MRIFFLASVDVSDKSRKSYTDIVKILQSEGNEVLSKHSLAPTKSIEKMNQSSNEIRAKRLMKEMLRCDCVVFEGTRPTTGGGYYIFAALQRSLPVLYLSQEEYKGLFLASSNRLLRIRTYDPTDFESLKKVINDFLKFTYKKRLNNRFNLMISDSMVEFLNKTSKDNGTSRADFIRDLIYKEMEND